VIYLRYIIRRDVYSLCPPNFVTESALIGFKMEKSNFNTGSSLVVLGAGIVGLQTALILKEAGLDVIILAKDFPGSSDPWYTSAWSGAVSAGRAKLSLGGKDFSHKKTSSNGGRMSI
jgi:pyruvate/2-oxoglutarate dehydrogenase complex dihydrolipoamide dehydrogenase (E3) component